MFFAKVIPFLLSLTIDNPCPLQRRALQQQVNLLSQEVSRLEHELDESQERGDSAMLQASGACYECDLDLFFLAGQPS